jgi:hypothetical protein
MFDKSVWESKTQDTWQSENKDVQTTEDIETKEFDWIPGYRFVVGIGALIVFF